MRFLLVVLLALPIVSCTQIKEAGCAVGTLVVHTSVPVLAGALECANQAAVEADLHKILNVTGLCALSPNPNATVGPKGSGSVAGISPVLCAFVSNAVASFAAKGIPAAWQCQATSASGSLAAVIGAACLAIPL